MTLTSLQPLDPADHTPAVLRGYRLVFNLLSLPHVEPSFANVEEGEEGDEVHGVAFAMDEKAAQRMRMWGQSLSFNRTHHIYVCVQVVHNHTWWAWGGIPIGRRSLQ